jgi:hypothetical protein
MKFALSTAAIAAVAAMCACGDSRQSDGQAAAQQVRAERAEIQAASQAIFIKPWDKYIECGVQQHDLRECRREYWPGQVYPDQPIAGEKEPGMVWRCSGEQRDRRSPPRKVCFADASDARKRAYPCPPMVTGPRLSVSEPVCARATARKQRATLNG